MNHKLYTALLFSLFVVTPAMANPLKTVGIATVTKDLTTVEFRSSYSIDDKLEGQDGRVQLRQIIDHGVTDWYALRLTTVQDNIGVDNIAHDALQLDNRFQLFERDEHGFDGGFRLSYVLRDGARKPDVIDVRWINQIPFWETYEFRHHVILQHQVGEHRRSGIMPELRWQVSRPLTGAHRIGLEMFNEFGNVRNGNKFSEQNHDAGFLITGPFIGKTRYHTGYRHSISANSPDHAFKFFVAYDF